MLWRMPCPDIKEFKTSLNRQDVNTRKGHYARLCNDLLPKGAEALEGGSGKTARAKAGR